MSTTKTDVRIRYMRAEFTGVAPFSDRKGWVVRSFSSADGLVHETLPRRRAWTVARDVLNAKLTPGARNRNPRDITADIANRYRGIDIDAKGLWRAVIVPDEDSSRFGTLLIIEEMPR